MLPSRPRVLVAYKSSALEHYQAGAGRDGLVNVASLLEAGDPSVSNLRTAHDSHYTGLRAVVAELRARGFEVELKFRGEVEVATGYDLVVTVGGDGTVLDLSHHLLGDAPLLGVNSDPNRSVGYFCGATVETLPSALDALSRNELPVYRLGRLRLKVNGAVVGPPVLNDLLVTDLNPAATCRYLIEAAGHQEAQRSSGVWVSTPAGSTAAIRSAGGLVLPLRSQLLQYLVREPYPPITGRYNLLRGVLTMEDGLAFTCQMEQGAVYVDGPHTVVKVGVGDRIEVRPHSTPLHLLGIDASRRVA